ncbi:MAG: alpha/beta hydrolase [Oligoflexia bacterium]|nr:alpha/beta hydrolase [Oligoflexia bacterium]
MKMNWLLLRGLAREQRHWAEFPNLLRAAFPESTIHCLDLPGTGTERRRASPLSIGAIVADLRERWCGSVSDEARLARPWGVIGISLGGMVAMHWSHKHPADFARLVLINSSTGDLSPPYARIRPSALAAGLLTLFAADPLAKERRILELTTRLKRSDLTSIALKWSELAVSSPIPARTVLSQILAAAFFRAPRSLPAPALILSSGRDAFTSAECSQALAKRYQAPLVVHPEAGHDLPLDDPEWLLAELRRWIC